MFTKEKPWRSKSRKAVLGFWFEHKQMLWKEHLYYCEMAYNLLNAEGT